MTGRKIPYPWGRVRPDRRMRDLSEMIDRLDRQKEVLKLQFEESLKKIDMSKSALSDQIVVAQSFEEEDKWSELRERIYDLKMLGIDALSEISGLTLSEANARIENMELKSKEAIDDDKTSDVDSDFLTSSIGDIGSLFDGEDL